MDSRGQTCLEFIASFGLVLFLGVGLGKILKDQWNRSQCAYVVFEKTHAFLVGSKDLDRSHLKIPVQITESSEFVQGEARCGLAVERIQLPRLESARW